MVIEILDQLYNFRLLADKITLNDGLWNEIYWLGLDNLIDKLEKVELEVKLKVEINLSNVITPLKIFQWRLCNFIST